MRGIGNVFYKAVLGCLLLIVGECFGETLVFQGIMLGQNIEAARTVFLARNSDLIKAGEITDGKFTIGGMFYNGRHFPLDGTNGVVVADDLDRVQSIICQAELLEKLAGFAFADARMTVEWLIAEFKLSGMEAVQAGRPALDPFTYEYRAQSSGKPYYIRVLADKSMVIQSMAPNRRK